ncbi:MAG: adenine deaminase C-terminal domain-containing protein [Oscillospiraceae bacterium]
MTTDSLKKLVLAAQGKIPFDKLFVNMKLIDVYSERIIENASVGVCDGIISSVCPGFEAKAEKVIDCKGMYASPSFIDCHMHIESSHLSPAAYCEGAAVHGTGCIFTDPMQTANAAGEEGLKAFLELLSEQPVHSFLQFPSRVPAAEGKETSGAYFSPDDTIEMMNRFGAFSLGEVNAQELLKQSSLEKICCAMNGGYHINGHCPALEHDMLCASASAGISDDHESENGTELKSRLFSGIPVFIRQGSSEPNCAALVSEVVKDALPTDSLMFCTDDKSPSDILKNGCIDNNIRIAIKCGMPPITAIKLASLNAARHYGIERNVGSLTPGRYADIVLFEDLENINIRKVFFKGEPISKKKSMIADIQSKYPSLFDTVKLPSLTYEMLLKKAAVPDGFSNEICISMKSGSLLTYRSDETLKVSNGFVMPDIERDILPIAVIERYGKNGNIGKAFIKGLGIKKGAVASSTAQEGNNIVVSGADPDDMLLAVKAVAAAGGGSAVCVGGKLIALRPMPFCGIMGTGSIEEEIGAAEKFNEGLKATGSDDTMLMLKLTVSLCPSIPEIGLTDKGLIL